MKKLLLFIMIITLTCLTAYSELTAEEILRKIDEQMLTKTAYSEATMTINTSDTNPRTLYFKSFSKGTEFSLLEFTAPAREKGTKFLRREKTMWLYFPRADRVRQIKGHMLRQGMMGSDFSYEDASETDSVIKKYNAKIMKEESYEKRNCYVLELNAKSTEVTYQKRIIWVDKEWFVPLKEELYAKSGILLKELIMSDVKKISGHYYPTKWIMINKLTGSSSTELQMKKLQIDIPVPDNIFSLTNLKKR